MPECSPSSVSACSKSEPPITLNPVLLMRPAMAVMLYALYTYHWRAASIRRGGRGPYDDRLGPVRSTRFPFSVVLFMLTILFASVIFLAVDCHLLACR